MRLEISMGDYRLNIIFTPITDYLSIYHDSIQVQITLGAKNLMPKNFSYIQNADEIFRLYIFRRRNFSTTNYLGGVIFLFFAIYTKFQNKIPRYILIAKIHGGYFFKITVQLALHSCKIAIGRNFSQTKFLADEMFSV